MEIFGSRNFFVGIFGSRNFFVRIFGSNNFCGYLGLREFLAVGIFCANFWLQDFVPEISLS